ncbi:lipoyl synthase [bacterium]|nr:lipoyl synthase [bacterium]MCP5462120.1 lipoyl synthase [bacterium]
MQNNENTVSSGEHKPAWLRTRGILDPIVRKYQKQMDQYEVKTVCKEASCPNRHECWSQRSFTFILLGEHCTRSCRYCDIDTFKPEQVDPHEPANVARFVKDFNLNHVVLTSVTRDDLEDGGAGHFVKTMQAVRAVSPDIPIELLIPDFEKPYLDKIIAEKPDILGHNIETPRRLYRKVRPVFKYDNCLEILRYIKAKDPKMLVKSAIIAGMGETKEEIIETLIDLKKVDCDIVYIGQYIAPSKRHHPVIRYYTPAEFDEFRTEGEKLGIRSVVSGPMVRSSYKSWEDLKLKQK